MSMPTFALVLIVLAVIASVVTGYHIQIQKKALKQLVADLHATRANLGHARERTKAARDLVGFYQRQKDEFPSKIADAEETLERFIREEQEEAAQKEKGEKEGEGASEKSAARHEIKVAGSLERRR